MSLSVRLPQRVEQKLAEYCVTHKVSKSEAVKRALGQLLDAKPVGLSKDPYARRFIGGDTRPGDVARHTKRLLREHFRAK